MTTPLQQEIARQRQRLSELREEAGDIGQTLADEVWDRFEVEIESATADGFMFDFASSVKTVLAMSLSIAYDEAFERHVLSCFAHLEKALRQAGLGEAEFAGAGIDLAGLRKGLKLHRHADALIGQAIERAKPGPARILGTMLCDLVRDELEQMEAMERDMQRNAERLKEELYALRGELMGQLAAETTQLIKQGIQTYRAALDALETRPAQTVEEAA